MKLMELPAKKKPNHPCHLHALSKVDTREIYGDYEAKWRCDACQRVFDGLKDGFLSSEEEEETDNRHTYHCSLCNFDLCTQCFKGYIHTFHWHRLKMARAPLIYPDTNGQWRCDACRRVFSELTEQICYHCQKCEVDLCKKCFEGEWRHVLHPEQDHTLKPMDPRIEYRIRVNWECGNCGRECTHEDTPSVFFHCTVSGCDFDLCSDCFLGEKHHSHQHNLVKIDPSRHQRSDVTCSQCNTRITASQYYCCFNPSCHFALCRKCHSTPPQPHPYHPSHTLEVWDAGQKYPQSGGMWHCDNCTSNHPLKEATPIQPSEPMYHCELCEYDLCEQCYGRGLRKSSRNGDNDALKPVQVAEGGEDDTYQPYTMNYFTTEPRSRPLSRTHPPLSYLTTPFVPPHRLCIVCKTYPARMTFIHRGKPHAGPALCCSRCTSDILRYRKPCPDCGQAPEKAVDVR